MVLFSLSTILSFKIRPKTLDLCKNFPNSRIAGRPAGISAEGLAEALAAAQADLLDESARTRAGFRHIPDPGSAHVAAPTHRISLADAASLKRKFTFLNDYSNEYIQSTPLDVLLRAETTAFKLREMERGADLEDTLANNRDVLISTLIEVLAGVDNRWDRLHHARFLPGASCSARQMWLFAREYMGNTGHQALSSYDMASVGLQGCVSNKGWIVIANPGSSQLKVRYFNMTSCSNKVLSTRGTADKDEISATIEELGEFKLALRALRVAMSFVHPWNKSIEAISSFFEQSDFCHTETSGLEKRAALFSNFTDYILEENSNRWRAKEGFITTGEMKECWTAFISTRPQALLATVKAANNSKHQNSKPSFQQQRQPNHPAAAMSLPNPYFDNICVRWNQGRCLAAPGTCKTGKGMALRHCCNFRPNPANNPNEICQGNHAACFYHR